MLDTEHTISPVHAEFCFIRNHHDIMGVRDVEREIICHVRIEIASIVVGKGFTVWVD